MYLLQRILPAFRSFGSGSLVQPAGLRIPPHYVPNPAVEISRVSPGDPSHDLEAENSLELLEFLLDLGGTVSLSRVVL